MQNPARQGESMRVAVLGGAGYIGSHTACVLVERGHEVVIGDNLSNGTIETVDRVRAITGKDCRFVQVDIRDRHAVTAMLKQGQFDAVLHFAALKSVGESCRQPVEYFDNNIAGTVQLLLAMQDSGCKTIVFSSSATVYGTPERMPLQETDALGSTNPYGRSKLVTELMLQDACRADPMLGAVCLRYFNPVGAHPSGLLGESPTGVPDNLMPYICQVASGKRSHLSIFGGDWPTVDGTGVRDYIHVMDLAEAHADALACLHEQAGYRALNLGTGQGTSVLELVHAFERVNGVRVPYRITARRDGDVAEAYADASEAARVLGWRTRRGIDAMCRDAWNWERDHLATAGAATPVLATA